MRDTTFRGDTQLAQHNTKTVLAVVLATAVSALALMVAVTYPSVVVGLVALALVVRIVARRFRRGGFRRARMVRVPFTNTVLKV